MKEAVIKIITMILRDGERIKRALVIILSIIVGLLQYMVLLSYNKSNSTSILDYI